MTDVGTVITKAPAQPLPKITIPRPSNFHSHLRTGPLRQAVAKSTMAPWHFLLAMPNLNPPLATVADVKNYRGELERLRDELELQTKFISSIYLTNALTPDVIEELALLDFPIGVKYYPPHKGATTGSGHGIPLSEAVDVLEAMTDTGIRLLGHFETVYDASGNELPHEVREDYFMMHEWPWLRDNFFELKITIEHATTAAAIRRVEEDTIGTTNCTITPQAMLHAREDLNSLTWGVHAKCMPIAKTPTDREVVRGFALSGDYRTYLGDDNAPHLKSAKLQPFPEAANGCFWPHSIAAYVDIFERAGKLQELVQFACYNGVKAWGLPQPTDTITLRRDEVTRGVPDPILLGDSDESIIPFGWTIAGDSYGPGLVVIEG
jgi:dihydroorotase